MVPLGAPAPPLAPHCPEYGKSEQQETSMLAMALATHHMHVFCTARRPFDASRHAPITARVTCDIGGVLLPCTIPVSLPAGTPPRF